MGYMGNDSEQKKRRFYWLQLKTSFFDQIHVRFLLAQKNGDSLLVTYEKLLLLSIENGRDGAITFNHFQETFEDELAFTIQRPIEEVQTVLALMTKYQQVIQPDDNTLAFCEAIENTGSEGSSAERKRKYDDKKRMEKQQGNSNNDIFNIFQ
jgi:predicted phage replisome organizer